MIGYTAFSSNGVVWRKQQGALVLLSPPHLLNNFSKSDAVRLMRDTRSLMIRWETEFDSSRSNHWWHVLKDGNSGLGDLSGNTRSKVRRGLRSYLCQPITRDFVIDFGYEVYADAFSRYVTHEECFSRSEFQKSVEQLASGTEFWGAIDRETGRLEAFSENYVESKTCFYNTIWFKGCGLKKYASYALIFEMNKSYLDDQGFIHITDGARSISHPTEIHDYLISKFGFRKAYATINVEYRPWLLLLVKGCFPFRMIFERISLNIFKKAAVLLRQEEINRQCREMHDD